MANYDLALVLTNQATNNGHLLVTMLTFKTGKRVALANGIRQGTARMCGAAEPITLLAARIEGNTPATLRDAVVVDDFPELKANWQVTKAALQIANAGSLLTAELQPQPTMLAVLLQALPALPAQAEVAAAVATVAIMRLITAAGWQPEVNCCVSCRRTDTPLPRFDFLQGGAVCAACPSHPEHTQDITPDTLYALRDAIKGIIRPNLATDQLAQELVLWHAA